MNDMIDAELYNQVRDDINLFADSSEKGFVLVLAGPGCGKTTYLLSTIDYLYGEYTTSKSSQVYYENDGGMRVIPAGSGNEATEDEETFNLKTNYGKDIYYTNSDLRVGFIAFNSKIVKEISKKVFKTQFLIGMKGREKAKSKNIVVKTSHGLLWNIAEKLGMFNLGVVTDYSKGSFTSGDANATLFNIANILKDKRFESLVQFKDEYKQLLDSKSKVQKLSQIFKEFCDNYYETTILFTGENTYSQLYKKTQESFDKKKKENKINVLELITRSFSPIAIEEVRVALKNDSAAVETFFAKLYLISMRTLIATGEITVGHSYYYKKAYIKCMKDKSNLLKLFSVDNDPNKYLNVLFVDEAQDLTPVMINLLVEYFNYAKENNLQVSISMVGDSNQAIYAFSQRENAFRSIVNKVGEDKVKYIERNHSYRVPQNVCNFINNACKNIYKDQAQELSSATVKSGYTFDEYLPLEDFIYFATKQNYKAIIIGRSNVEITVAYVKAFLKLAKSGDSEDSLEKSLKIDSKVKKSFESVINKGVDGIDDTLLKEKIKKIANKEKVSLSEIRSNPNIYKIVPGYIKELANIAKDYTKQELSAVFEQKATVKSKIVFMTAHTAKGLESDYVYLLDGINESLFPKKDDSGDLNAGYDSGKSIIQDLKSYIDGLSINHIQNFDEDKESDSFPKEEEANIFYVAASRAEKGLFLDKNLFSSFSSCIDNQNTYLLNNDKTLIELHEGFNTLENNKDKTETILPSKIRKQQRLL